MKADINDPSSLILAFKGATVIFGVTDFWHPFYDPENQKKFKPGQTINQFCYDLEFTQGRNIADAAATVESLERYVWSSLSSAKKWSKGKYTWAYHLDAKAYVDEYIKEKQPKLWEKTSVLQVGFFLTNWQVGIGGRPQKVEFSGPYLHWNVLTSDKKSIRYSNRMALIKLWFRAMGIGLSHKWSLEKILVTSFEPWFKSPLGKNCLAMEV